jgi:hypothetical protein
MIVPAPATHSTSAFLTLAAVYITPRYTLV